VKNAQTRARIGVAVATLALAIVLSRNLSGGANAASPTTLAMLCSAPDITVVLQKTVTVTPQQVYCSNFSGPETPISFPIPAGTRLTGYFPLAGGALITIDTTALLPTNNSGGTVLVTPRDVAAFSNSTGFFLSSLTFQGSASGVPDGVRIDTLAMSGSALVLSFDTTTTLSLGSTTITARPADLVSFSSGTWSKLFDSSAAGVPDGMNVEGAAVLSNGDYLLSFDTGGSLGGVTFGPTQVLEYNPGANTWALSYDGPSVDGWPDGSIIQGVFAQTPPEFLTITPPSLDFPNVGTDTSATLEIKLKNTGKAKLTGSVSNGGLVGTPFSIKAGSGNFSLAHNATKTVTIKFAPTAPVESSGSITVASSDPGNGDVQVGTSGTGVPGTLSVSAPMLDFPATKVGKAKSLKLTIKNTGLGVLHVTVSSSAPFSATPGTFNLDDKKSKVVKVKFAPTATGRFQGTVTITSDGSAPSGASVSVTGTGQ
jgi:hypothetical protein